MVNGGDQTLSLRTQERFNDAVPHTITLLMDNRNFHLLVDDIQKVWTTCTKNININSENWEQVAAENKTEDTNYLIKNTKVC